MIVETIVGKNFHDEPDSFVARFHISEAILMEHFEMRDKLARLTDVLSGPERALRMDEIQEMIDMVKFFMSISYGIKAVDGSRFDQDDPVGTGAIWHDFRASWAYSTFLLSLFRPDPIKLTEFIVRVLPKELRENAEEEARKGNNPQLLAAMQAAEKAQKTQEKNDPDRLAPGTQIVDGVPVAPRLTSVPSSTGTDVDPNMNYEALLDSETPKTPILQSQYDKMQESLKPAQFEHFMSTRYVDDTTE